MQFSIEVINVKKETKPTAKGSYDLLDVAYKRLDNGKIEGKKIMSFTVKDVFNALVNASNGSQFTVTSEKVGEFWNWTAITPMSGGSSTASSPSSYSSSSKGNPTPKSTYETPEERAAKQILIVRQSSLSNAIETTKNEKKPPAVEEIMAVAERYVNWVMQKEAPTVEDSFYSMEDDVPM